MTVLENTHGAVLLEVPQPSPPQEPQPGSPDVPTPDPKGPETPQED